MTAGFSRPWLSWADLGMLQVDGATGLGWIELATATEDLLTLGPPARETYPRRLNYDFPR